MITILQAQGGGYQTLIMFGLIALVMYFFMIRPQMKKSKEQKKFRSAISKGDKIVTIGGIHGRIKDVNETTVMIETDGGAKMRIEKSAISLEFSSGKGEEAATEIEQNK